MRELLFCGRCGQSTMSDKLRPDWICPHCNEVFLQKVEIDGYMHSCRKLMPSELSAGDIVTLDRKNIFSIIDISNTGTSYRIALKNYGVKTMQKTNTILSIMGSW